MHRLGVRHAEVAVISDELIRKAVCKPNSNDDEIDALNVDAIHEGDHGTVDFARLRVLSLSFRNIFKIDNLETLRNLTKLQLDNNVVQEIQGIGHLTQLEWLDLSFNNITRIQGLETLVNLTDLSLYNNCIAKLENLEHLKKLQVLSIGNNSITTTDGLLYLKTLETLRVLNLSGNPVCSDPEYRPFLLAHLDRLQYLDYALVDSAEVLQAREQYQDELEELKEVKAIEEAALAREAEQVKYLAMLKDANVLTLETLLADMFKEDTEMAKIESLPGLRNLIEDYTEKAKAATEDVKAVLLDKYGLLSREVDHFHRKYETIQKEAQDASIQGIERYRRTAKGLLKQAASASPGTGTSGGPTSPDAEATTAALARLQDAETARDKLHSELMNVESDLVETAQELIAAVEISVEAIGAEARELATEHFRAIEVLENNFFESVSQLAVTLLERMASEDAEDDDFLSDECRAVLNDRDALNNAINGSHDIHIGKLLAQEDVLREHSVAKIQELVQQAKSAEWTRNRKRVAEIIAIKETHGAEIHRVREELNRVDEEFY